MEEDILKQFRVKFGSREQWIKAPANTHFVKRSQIDFYNNLEAFLLKACKESYERGFSDGYREAEGIGRREVEISEGKLKYEQSLRRDNT